VFIRTQRPLLEALRCRRRAPLLFRYGANPRPGVKRWAWRSGGGVGGVLGDDAVGGKVSSLSHLYVQIVVKQSGIIPSRYKN